MRQQQDAFELPKMYAAIVLTALLGFGINVGLRAAERRTVFWVGEERTSGGENRRECRQAAPRRRRLRRRTRDLGDLGPGRGLVLRAALTEVLDRAWHVWPTNDFLTEASVEREAPRGRIRHRSRARDRHRTAHGCLPHDAASSRAIDRAPPGNPADRDRAGLHRGARLWGQHAHRRHRIRRLLPRSGQHGRRRAGGISRGTRHGLDAARRRSRASPSHLLACGPAVDHGRAPRSGSRSVLSWSSSPSSSARAAASGTTSSTSRGSSTSRRCTPGSSSSGSSGTCSTGCSFSSSDGCSRGTTGRQATLPADAPKPRVPAIEREPVLRVSGLAKRYAKDGALALSGGDVRRQRGRAPGNRRARRGAARRRSSASSAV